MFYFIKIYLFSVYGEVNSFSEVISGTDYFVLSANVELHF